MTKCQERASELKFVWFVSIIRIQQYTNIIKLHVNGLEACIITATNQSPSSHKSILYFEEEGPISDECKIVIFSKQYKILEIRKWYSMALVFNFDIPQIVSPGT